VEFESQEGEGTTFRFRMPLAASHLNAELEAAVHLENILTEPRS
jgi:carbon monoxide dehydrogenase subunit G